MSKKFAEKVASQLSKKAFKSKKFGKYITVYYGPRRDFSGKLINDAESLINWAAIGSVIVDEAEEFVNNLQEAIIFAEEEEAKANILREENKNESK